MKIISSREKLNKFLKQLTALYFFGHYEVVSGCFHTFPPKHRISLPKDWLTGKVPIRKVWGGEKIEIMTLELFFYPDMKYFFIGEIYIHSLQEIFISFPQKEAVEVDIKRISLGIK